MFDILAYFQRNVFKLIGLITGGVLFMLSCFLLRINKDIFLSAKLPIKGSYIRLPAETLFWIHVIIPNSVQQTLVSLQYRLAEKKGDGQAPAGKEQLSPRYT